MKENDSQIQNLYRNWKDQVEREVTRKTTKYANTAIIERASNELRYTDSEQANHSVSKLLRHSTKLERRMTHLSSKAFKLSPRKDGRETGRPWNKINHIVEIFRFYKSASKRQAMKTKLGGNDPEKQSTEQGILLRRINWMWSSQLANKRPARLLFA